MQPCRGRSQLWNVRVVLARTVDYVGRSTCQRCVMSNSDKTTGTSCQACRIDVALALAVAQVLETFKELLRDCLESISLALKQFPGKACM